MKKIIIFCVFIITSISNICFAQTQQQVMNDIYIQVIKDTE